MKREFRVRVGRAEMRGIVNSKLIQKVFWVLAAIGMVAGITAVPSQASAGGYLVVGISVDASKLTNAQLEFFDAKGAIVGTCFADSVTVKDGDASFPCDFSGYAKSAELVVLTSDQLEEVFGVVSVGDCYLVLESLSGAKHGWFAVDLGGNLPTFRGSLAVDLGGNLPTF
jgi:hypothetical protein